jgi:hypothetical protein
MLRRIQDKLSYANVTASLALFLALGGAAVYAAGEIGAGDIKDDAVRSRHIKDRQVRQAELAVPLRHRWAVVYADETDPTIARGRGAVGLNRLGDGEYEVKFDRRVNDCSPSATQMNYGGILSVVARTNSDEGMPSPGFGDDEVYVATIDNNAQTTDINFSVQVFC